MTAVEKPQAKPGLTCPLWHKDVSKVCHRCVFWEAWPVLKPVAGDPNNARVIDQWDCTVRHQTFLLRDVRFGIDGLQKDEESFRNSAWKESQSNLHDIVEAVKQQSNFNRQVLAKVGEGMSELARVVEARQLSGPDKSRS